MCSFCVFAQKNSATDTLVVNQKYKGMENILKTNLPHHQQERNTNYSSNETTIRICTLSWEKIISSPLFIINYENKVYKTSNSEKGGVLKMINPNDISTISILKDDEATKKYGDDGKNGVVIVTIKDKVADFAKDLKQRKKDLRKIDRK